MTENSYADSHVVVVGCGYTGRRVAERLAKRGLAVIATSRSDLPLDGVQHVRTDFETAAADLSWLPPGARVLFTVPTLEPDTTPAILSRIAETAARLVYLSTTGVYGSVRDVDEHTEPGPHARRAAEEAVLSAPCSTIVLRPAAIYGPDRGIHVSMREGRFRIGGDGSNFVSRIHVDDLATHCIAALFSDIRGAWPVADEHPCTTKEIAEFCAEKFDLPIPPSPDAATLHRTRQADRRVDGRGIRQALGITLQYPTYREGLQIPR